MPDNNEIFLDFWQNFQWPEPEQLCFRLYYDDQGRPICYSRTPMSGNYIEVTPEQFAIGDMSVRVKNNTLIKPARSAQPKLVPGDQGVCCHPRDVTVIVDAASDHLKWTMKHD